MKRIITCQQCHEPLIKIQQKYHRKFCSRNCKGESQKKRIILTCTGCSKKFSVHPYLKRKSNYCSRKCYWDSTRTKEKRLCSECHKQFFATGAQLRNGFGIYCSKKCQNKVYQQKRVVIVCKHCGNKLLPPSVAIQRNASFCSKKCRDDYERDYVQRTCKNCHQNFQLPRWELNKGKGNFCSRGCFIQYKGETAIEKKIRYVLQEAQIEFLQEFKIGIYHADFLLPQHRIVLECDGDYWHSIPTATKRDQRKDDYLQNQGYRIVRIAEETIRRLTQDKLTSMLYQIIEPSAASETTGRDL